MRLALVIGSGLQVAAAGLAQVRATARAGQVAETIAAGRVVDVAAGTIGRAGRSLLRASGRAGWAGWSAWSAAHSTRPPSRMQRIRRALVLGRAALFAWGGRRHDRR